jgi:HEAT repeat protein
MALEDKDPLVTGVAYLAARKIDRTAVPILMRLLHSSPNENTRISAATFLGETKLPEAVIPLREALNDTSFQVRATTSFALVKLGDSAGRGVLTAAGSDANLKFHAMVALCELGEQAYLDALRDVFLHGDERLQNTAVAAAKTATKCPVRPILESALVNNPYSSVRSLAMETIAANATAADLPVLRTGAASNDESVRFFAARSLVMLGDASGIPIVESALKSAVHRLRQRYRELIREEIAQTVSSASEVDEEIRYLLAVIRG